jgi:hypothetical protein
LVRVVERGDVGESSWAFEGFEKMTWFDVGDAMVGMKLEKLLAGARTAQTAQHTELAVMDVGIERSEMDGSERDVPEGCERRRASNVGAPILAQGLGIELKNIREKPR